MARTSSLNCLSCGNPYQTPDSLNCLPPFHWKPLSFPLKSASSHPLPKNRLWKGMASNAGVFPGPKCSKSRDLIAIAICDSNRESQTTSDLRLCEPSQKSPLLWLVVQEMGVAILTAIWTEAQITNRAIWICDLSCSRQRFGGNPCDLGMRFQITSDLRFVHFGLEHLVLDHHLDLSPPLSLVVLLGTFPAFSAMSRFFAGIFSGAFDALNKGSGNLGKVK